MLWIMFFIIILNVVAIALTYYCLSEVEGKEKLIFIAVGVAVIYILTSLVYWISTKDVAIKAVSEMGKNLITFLFVPINGMIILPILAKSYAKYKTGRLALENLKNRGLVLVMVLAILLIIECMYFKEIQTKVVDIVEKNRQEQIEREENMPSISNKLQGSQTNEISSEVSNTISNQININVVNDMTNSIQANQISNEIANENVTE